MKKLLLFLLLPFLAVGQEEVTEKGDLFVGVSITPLVSASKPSIKSSDIQIGWTIPEKEYNLILRPKLYLTRPFVTAGDRLDTKKEEWICDTPKLIISPGVDILWKPLGKYQYGGYLYGVLGFGYTISTRTTFVHTGLGIQYNHWSTNILYRKGDERYENFEGLVLSLSYHIFYRE